jgi:hypothetical protein
MKRIAVALGRAGISILHPWNWLLALLALVLMVVFWAAVGNLQWENAVNLVQRLLANNDRILWIVDSNLGQTFGRFTWRWQDFKAPLVLAVLALPWIIATCSLLVAIVGIPMMTRLIASRQYPELLPTRAERPDLQVRLERHVSRLVLMILSAIAYGISSTLAMSAWLSPLAGGVVTFVMASVFITFIYTHGILALLASDAERRSMSATHLLERLALGAWCVCWLTLPSAVWLASVSAFVFAPSLAIFAFLLFALVLCASALSFVHYCLEALHRVRYEFVKETG